MGKSHISIPWNAHHSALLSQSVNPALQQNLGEQSLLLLLDNVHQSSYTHDVPQRSGCLLCLFESAYRTEFSLVHFVYFVYLFLKVEIYALSTATQLMFWLTGACYYDSNQSMYVFGGCTQSSCNAAFNDLWRLDLNSKEWIRPLASGTSPLLPVKLAEITISSYTILIYSICLPICICREIYVFVHLSEAEKSQYFYLKLKLTILRSRSDSWLFLHVCFNSAVANSENLVYFISFHIK